ncbi:translation elongation factor Ts [Candidatus Microgenomates bacterium]|nr:translation elongation factor Ts [Candidatus Microgenomates bacterium]
MSLNNVDVMKRLREETGAPIMRVKQVLDEQKGNEKKALEILRKEGFEKAAKRTDRVTGQGKVFSYIHHSSKIGSMVELLCETDFVARNELFEELGKNIAMQIASLDPKDLKDLKSQDFIKDSSKKIEDLVKEVIAKTGENVQIGRFTRFELGKE